ncbi:MAG TPA: hypothetical protein VFE51_11190 [Verrucomicrobiae bacterium]|nr:hypothetical protein [Verrucomicrobiae bacterium]
MVNSSPEIDPAWITAFADHLGDEMGPCPRTGGGVHRYIYRAAVWLKDVCDKNTAVVVIRRLIAHCGREVPDREIRSAVTIGFKADPSAAVRKWPAKNQLRINEIARTGLTLAQLEQRSPVKPGSLAAWKIVDMLHPGNPDKVKLCFALDERRFATRTKAAHLKAAAQMQFLVANAMKASMGTTLEGKRSERSKDNVGHRRFLVSECDPMKWEDLPNQAKAAFGSEENYKKAKKDESAAVIWHLAETEPRFPLILVVDSAGKSLHAWWLVEGSDEDDLLRFFRYAVTLGADPLLWNPVQLVRMPGGRRPDGRIQRVVYFNPQPLEVP